MYLAPLQGITDTIFRREIRRKCPEITKTYTPFFSIDSPSKTRDRHYQNHVGDGPEHVIPQFISADGKKLAEGADRFGELGFTECNLNLGCPFPTVTKKGRGSALLQYPNRIDSILNDYFSASSLSLSVKVRLGFTDPDELSECIYIFNKYPLKEVIVHPRTALQKYEGSIDYERFNSIREMTDHNLIYNGEIRTLEDYKNLLNITCPEQKVMIGRGVLFNTMLPAEISGGTEAERDEKAASDTEFFITLYTLYREKLCGDTQFLQKMKNLCSYMIPFSNNYKKEYKKIFKTGSVDSFHDLALYLFELKYES